MIKLVEQEVVQVLFIYMTKDSDTALLNTESRKGPGKPEASRPAGRYNAKFDKPNDLQENCR